MPKDDPIFQVTPEKWNDEYAKGQWNYLSDIHEMAHYAVTVGFLAYMGAARSLLDVGCGNGVLVEYLRRGSKYDYYLGIDICQVAIEHARRKTDEVTAFLIADAEQYVPQCTFTGIVFNECLYYLRYPCDVVYRYTQFLTDNGVLVTSLFVSSSTVRKLIDELRRRFRPIEEIEVRNKRGTWLCSVFAKPRHL